MSWSWTTEVGGPDGIAGALRDLERACHMGGGWVRTATATLVVLVDAEDLDRARRTLREVADREAVRTIVLVAGSVPTEVTVRRLEHGAAGRSVAEVLTAVGNDPSADAIQAAVSAARIPSAPVIAWVASERMADLLVLADVADRLIVDTTRLSGDGVNTLRTVAGAATVADVGWIGLRPWRQLVAGLFAGPEFAAWTDRVAGGVVHGSTGTRRLVGGWLLSRLGLPPGALAAEAGSTAVELHARDRAGGTAAFAVRSADDGMVVASATVRGGPSHRRRLVIGVPSLAELLRGAMAEGDSGVAWRAALAQGWGEA
jgi:glucose-6-phosphate dehydrogenase assembly protein OpcA